MRIVIGKESIVGPGDGERELGSILAMRAEQAGRFRFRVRLVSRPRTTSAWVPCLRAEAVEHGDAVVTATQLSVQLQSFSRLP